MSVDEKWPCFICGEDVYDTADDQVDGFGRGTNPWTCAKHVGILIRGFRAIFPNTGHSWTEDSGLELSWKDLKKITDLVRVDSDARTTTVTISDKQLYQMTP